ncbi:hypothetical protein C8Q79DRAFT_547315 [Trametes meyenii]|nr:hypothetical protein C8Q79DRAFT_547315 [Trametes meyenii]
MSTKHPTALQPPCSRQLLSMQSGLQIEQDDHDMQWLAREAPQFHTQPDPPRPASSFHVQDECDEDASGSSDNDSAGSDSDDDPYHPYNFHNPAQKWVRNGDFVYAADGLQDSYLSANTHAVNDPPYVPPEIQNKDPTSLFLTPDDLEPTGDFQPFVFRDDPPQTLSPLELTASLPSSPDPVSSASNNSSRARRVRGVSVRNTHDLSNVFSLDSDDEADASSGDDASEDEYVPSPRIRSRKLSSATRSQPQGRVKTRPAPRLSYSPYPSSSTSTSAGESSSTANSRRPGSRNVQIIDQPPPPRGSWPKTGPDAYKCPYCEHVQTNKRSPDMERHIRSHFRRTAQAQWVCCGLPLDEALRLGRGRGDNAWHFNGVLMVGGCHEDFSRMDALKRHWRNANNSCIGDIRYARVQDEQSQ